MSAFTYPEEETLQSTGTAHRKYGLVFIAAIGLMFIAANGMIAGCSSSSDSAGSDDETTVDVTDTDNEIDLGGLDAADTGVEDGGDPDSGEDLRVDTSEDSQPDGPPEDVSPDGTVTSETCSTPAPNYGSVSENYLIWLDWMVDGSFETESGVVELDEPGRELRPATLTRPRDAARTGDWGYEVAATSNQGGTFPVIWVRSPGGPATLTLDLLFVKGNSDELVEGESVRVGSEWTELRISAEVNTSYEYGLISVDVGPDMTIHFDDAVSEWRQWKPAEFDEGEGRVVGGINVPNRPAAPVHMSVLIHIEDPQNLETQEAYFQEQTAIFRELARVLHEHGGFLTIQPEHDWIEAAEGGFHPGLLQELSEDYNVAYSTHTHGPNCRDPEGVLRSAAACQRGWDDDIDDDDVIEYITGLQELIEDASGQAVTDHNGNFDFEVGSRLGEVPMRTWSGYKSFLNQRTYDTLMVNPWRPTDAHPLYNVDTFLTHDPETDIVYVPGWGQALSRQIERLPVRLPGILGQFIAHATPGRVNTFYFVTHVGHYEPDDRTDDYISYNARTGELTFGEQFERDLAYWDQMLTDTVDPLVEAGYLSWTPMTEVADLYSDWEEACEGLE